MHVPPFHRIDKRANLPYGSRQFPCCQQLFVWISTYYRHPGIYSLSEAERSRRATLSYDSGYAPLTRMTI
jgi:hypothetical protein